MTRRWILALAVGVSVTAAFVYWLATIGIEGVQIGRALSSAHPLALVGAAALGAIEMVLRAMRFRSVLAHFGHRLTIRRAWIVQVIGFFGGGITPLRVGEIGKAVILRTQEGVPIASGVAANLVERLFDFIAISVLLLLTVIPIAGTSSPFAPLAVVLLVVFGALYTALLLLPGPLLQKDWPLRLLGVRMSARIRETLAPLVTDGSARRRWLTLRMASWSSAIILLDVAVLGLLVAVLGGPTDVGRIAFAIALGSLVGVASFLPGGIAITEASYTFLLVQGGVPTAAALVAVLLARLLTFYPYMALGWFHGVRAAAAA